MKSISSTVNGGAVTLPSLYPGTFVPTLPARQVTIGVGTTLNPNWTRQIQISDQGIFCKRGNFAVFMSHADLINIFLTQEVGLTWTPPVILTQPVAATAAGTALATATLTNDGTNITDGDTVTIGTKVYTFQDTLTDVDGHVKKGASNTASMTNIFHAINASGGTAGTDYALSTVANTQVVATNPTGTTVVATSKISGSGSNTIATTEASTHLSWNHATLTGGTNSAATFTVVVGSEYNLTYQWQYSADGLTGWTNATGTVNGTAYTNGTTATLTCTPTTIGQSGYSHRCVVTDDASSPGSIDTTPMILTIP